MRRLQGLRLCDGITGYRLGAKQKGSAGGQRPCLDRTGREQ